MLVCAVLLTSSISPLDVEVNPANDMRVIAWSLAIDKIGESPWIGIGYPSDRPETGVNIMEIDQLLIAESWYLAAAITFGVPYLFLRLSAYWHAFYYLQQRRNLLILALVPFLLIDFTYGGMFEGALVYTWVWLNLLAGGESEATSSPPKLLRVPATT